MTRKNIAYFDGQYGFVTLAEDGYEISTTRAHCDRYIHADFGAQSRQLCADGSFSGSTLTWALEPENLGKYFARDCNAKLYKTREGYVKAQYKIRADIARFGYPDRHQSAYFG
jgi:hypothetical protein